MLLYLHDIITGISDDDFIALQNDHPEEDPSRAAQILHKHSVAGAVSGDNIRGTAQYIGLT